MFLRGACARNAQEIADLVGEYFQGVYVRDNSQEDFVVDGGVEDYSTVLLIQLEEETVERCIVALNTQKGPGPDGISPLILKKIVLVVTCRCFLRVFHACGRNRKLSFGSRVVTREIFRTIVEYLFYLRFLSFLKS
jgi:hypothetical protein